MDPLNPDFTPTEEQALQGIDQLMALPSAEDAMPTYIDLGDKVRARLEAEFGPIEWRGVEPQFSSGYGCGGVYQYLPGRAVWINIVADRVFDDENWVRVIEILSEVTHDYGFTGQIPIANEAGNNHTTLVGDRNATIGVYSNSQFTVDIQSGCYLLEETRTQIEQYGVPDPEEWLYRFPNSTFTPSPKR